MNGPRLALWKVIGALALFVVASALFWRFLGRDAYHNYGQ